MPDDEDELIEALLIMQQAARGHADFDTWPDSAVRDLSLGRDFADALARDLGVAVSGLRLSATDRDPPDLLANGCLGIELTELVDQALVQEAVAEKRKGMRPGKYRDWTGDQLRQRLREIITKKDSATPKVEAPLAEYWLVIHTDEPGLSPDLVRSYLAHWEGRPCHLITRCFLLMSYFPGHGGRPVFELAVEAA